MKKLFVNFMLVAVAAMAFTSCNESIDEVTRPSEAKMVDMTIIASADTRTAIDEANETFTWSAGDKIKVIETSSKETSSTANVKESAEAVITGNVASFGVSFDVSEYTEFAYNAIYPASAFVPDNNNNNEQVKVILNNIQTPTATSFDPAADILVSKHIETTEQPTELNMQFKRLVAIGKMTLKGLPDVSSITSVSFTVGKDYVLAGRNYVNAVEGTIKEYGYNSPTNTLIMNYATGLTTRDIFFTCNPFEMAAGKTFTVKVFCEDFTYTREVTIPEARSLVFTEGDLTTFSVDMTTAIKESTSDFDGDYVVMAVNAGKYYALSCEANGTRLSSVDDFAYNSESTVTLEDENLVWTINKTEKGYTFKGANNQYLAWSGNGNSAKTQNDVYYLDIVESGNYYNVVSNADTSRKLQRNSDTQYPYFAFYTSAQWGDLLIVPAVVEKTPKFAVSVETIDFPAAGDTKTITVNAINGFDATVTAVSSEDWLTVTPNGYTYTVTATENNGDVREATITFSADGCESIDVTVMQDAGGDNTGGDVSGITYTKITSTSELTDGVYIIVYESGTSGYVFNGQDAAKGYDAATISNNTISADKAFAGEVTIAAMSEGYSLKVANGYMYGKSGDNKLLFADTAQVNTITISNGVATITSNTSVIKFNNASNQMRFRYYKSGQQAVTIYKKN